MPCHRYALPAGRPNRPALARYGDFPLWPHLMGVVRRGAVDIIVSWGEAIAFEQDSDRKAVAKSVERTVRQFTALSLARPDMQNTPGMRHRHSFSRQNPV